MTLSGGRAWSAWHASKRYIVMADTKELATAKFEAWLADAEIERGPIEWHQVPDYESFPEAVIR